MRKFIKQPLLALAAICASSAAIAKPWQVTAVLQANDGGYAFSGFHDASGSNPMCGTKPADITGLVSGSRHRPQA